MLPKQYRISDQGWVTVKSEGDKVFGPLFGLLIKKDQGKEGPKFGFIVSKKIDKRAVVRNRIKRRFSEALLSFLPEIKPGVKVVFLAKKTVVDRELGEIKKEMARMLKRGEALTG